MPEDEALAHYTLGASEAEHRRLTALARHEEDRVLDACARAGVAARSVAVDFGCGPLGALAVLKRVVGPDGTVIGVDASRQALATAAALTETAGVEARLVHADVHDVTPEQLGGPVDLAYTRLMLLHQADPARTVSALSRTLRDGGALIAHEPSDLPHHAPAAEPHTPAMQRVWELVIGAARARGAATDFGRRGRSYLEGAGLEVESHRAYVVHYPREIGFEIPRIALHSLEPVLEAHGLATRHEVAELDRQLRDAAHRSDTEWVASPLMFEWIARKPNE